MMSSLISAVNDLLNFHKSGNYGKFDRCVSKALRLFSVNLSQKDHATARNITFHYLRSSGFIDVSYQGTTAKWSRSPHTLIQLEDLGFVPIGTSHFQESVCETFRNSKRKCLDDSQKDSVLPGGVPIYPCLPLISDDPSLIQSKCKETGISVISNLQQTMFRKFPTASEILKECSSPLRDDMILPQNETFRLNFETSVWEQYNETRILDSGLYRIERKYSAPDYFVATEPRKHMLEVLSIHEREWYSIVALIKLEQRLPLKFDPIKKELTLPKVSNGFKIPTLLERCLRSGRIHGPRHDRSGRTYCGIQQSSVWELIAKLQIFKVRTL